MTQEQYDLWAKDWRYEWESEKTPCYDCNPEHQGKMIRQFKCSNPGFSDGEAFASYRVNSGIKKGKCSREINEERRGDYEKISKRLEAGESGVKLAKEFGFPEQTVYRIRSELVKQGRAKPGSNHIKGIDVKGKFLTLSEIARICHVDKSTISNRIRRHPGITGDQILDYYKKKGKLTG